MLDAIKLPFVLLWRGWKKFAHVLGIINTRILLTVSYFVIIALAWVGTTLARADLIDRRMTPKPSFYHPREPMQPSLESARRSF
ncbi:MAG: hypothetical protein OEX18_11490 [Candidatus Krumholzibacteria bacterium]|nr:hypothetical protein [Candidatus Krumholzibacteria bacterium]MDH4337884.1 hypothetical protein [Candidatus Krumholzibacteria bacterium]MDH5270231.1 hypothetical protein [Candidatus Krumholzibacteria bacterium]